jgi:hypothetical protein
VLKILLVESEIFLTVGIPGGFSKKPKKSRGID